MDAGYRVHLVSGETYQSGLCLLPVRTVLIFLFSMVFSCNAWAAGGTTGDTTFDAGWINRLPSRQIALAVFVYPIFASYDLKVKGVTESAIVHQLHQLPDDAARVEASISEGVQRALRARGFTVNTDLQSMRRIYISLWDSKVGSEPRIPEDGWRKRGSARAKRELLSQLREFVERSPSTTIVLVCMPVKRSDSGLLSLTNAGPRDVKFSGSELMQYRDEACVFDDSLSLFVLAIDDTLRVVGNAKFNAGAAIEIEYRAKTGSSPSVPYRSLTPEEWATREIVPAVLKALRLDQ